MPKARLVELYASGLGVIDEARVEFGPGFNVITGETGAGKTLLLDALGLCLGRESSNSRLAILNGMRAAALFVQRDGAEVLLSRESGSSGRLRCAINGTTSSTDALRAVADELIVVHGQHDSLSLRNRADVLDIIDRSAGVSTSELDHARRALRDARTLKGSLGGDPVAHDREIDLLSFQINEIVATKVTSATELDDCLKELTRLSELREGQAALASVLEDLDADTDEAILARFARTIGRVPPGATYELLRDSLRSALELARDAVRELGALCDPDVVDPCVIEQVETRVSVLQQMARKYGGSLEAVSEALAMFQSERERLVDSAERLNELDQEISDLKAREAVLASVVKRERTHAAAQLSDAVRGQLPRVALANSSLRFEVDGDDGALTQILFTPNPGMPEGPLQALASGGELSRVLLALSLVTARHDVVAVFDEVDAGVGGLVAQQIGECLREVGRAQQVLAVTHLASVAAKADHHFVIEKHVDGATTSTVVREVRGEARVREIARMLAGDASGAESRALAVRLLETIS